MNPVVQDHTVLLKKSRYTELIQLPVKAEEKYIDKIVRWSWVVLVVVSLLQCILFQTLANSVGVGCVLFAWAIVSVFFLRADVLERFPLSTFLILGFTTTQFYFPLLFTLLENKPIVFNLDLPFDVFFHSIAALLVLTLTHLLYQVIYKSLTNRKNSLLEKLGFFEAPGELQLWVMGMIGVGATAYVWLYSPSIGWATTGAASGKLIQGLVPFTYAPYFIPFGRMYGNRKKHSKLLMLLLVIFTVFVFMVSIGRNSRSGFMVGFASVGFAYGLGVLLNYFRPQFFTVKNIFVVVIGLWLFTGPIADISTAMVLVRGQRLNISYTELIESTLEAFKDKEAIRLARLYGNTEKNPWDEIYMDNLFIQRFSNLKYNDASLILAAKYGDDNSDMLTFSIDHFLSSFPLPVLEALNLEVDKDATNSVSYGDYFYYKVSGDIWALGGFRTGHFAGTGMAAFGWWYLLILGIGMLPVFLLFDKLCINSSGGSSLEKNSLRPEVRFSFCGLLSLTSVFQFLPVESVENILSFLLRGWVQMVVLYFVIYQLTRIATTYVSTRK